MHAVVVSYDRDSKRLLASVGVDGALVLVVFPDSPLVEICYYVDSRDVLAPDKRGKQVRLRRDLVAVADGDFVKAADVYDGSSLVD